MAARHQTLQLRQDRLDQPIADRPFLCRATTWAFVGSFFVLFAETPKGRFNFRSNDIASVFILGAAAIAIAHKRISRRQLTHFLAISGGLLFVGLVYLARRGSPQVGTFNGYAFHTGFYLLLFTSAAAYACFFYDESTFVEIFWKAAKAAIVVALACYVASQITHKTILVHPDYGTYRLQGLFSEPSAWAPVAPAAVLTAALRREWRWVLLAGTAGLLTNSPSVILTTAVGVPLFCLLVARWRRGRLPLLLLLLIVTPILANRAVTTDPKPYLASHNPAKVTVGRLLSGVANVHSRGATGSNARFASTKLTTQELHQMGETFIGLGPGASDEYYPAKFGSSANFAPNGGARPNSLTVYVLFDFGLIGATLVVFWILTTSWRMRRSPAIAALYVPLFVAMMINSAEGPDLYKFAVVGLLLYQLRWAPEATGVAPSLS